MNKNFMLSTCLKKNPGESRIRSANRQQLDVLERHIKPGVVFDVGASAGFFMKAAQDRGWTVYGNELSISAIEWAKKYYDIDIGYGFLEDLKLPKGHFDVVVLWNTLEHTHNPRRVLGICKDMLVGNGLIFIRVPNKKTRNELKKHYTAGHLFEFTEECLTKHLNNLIFQEVEKIVYNPEDGVPYVDYLYRNK